MPRKVVVRTDWNFLKFKPARVLDDGTVQEPPMKTEFPWESEKIRNLLDRIAHPESIVENDKMFKYLVSEEKATLEEVKHLGSNVQKITEKYKFPSRGIHQERHSMCSALFDELIRQVIVEHPDIGEILLKIRDHFRQEIYNYEQIFVASQAYGSRKQYMEKNDDRLNELEAEAEYLLRKQEKANEQVEKAYEENLCLIAECEDIDVDEVEYWRAVEFYQNYIKYLLYYFDLRADEEKIKQGIEDKEEDTEEEEEEQEVEGADSFSLGDDVLEEELEEIPGAQEEEIKVDTTKQQKEEPIDKDLVYRDNEEEVFDSDIETEQTIVSELPKSEDDVIPPTETDPQEQLQILFEEELKHDISFADVARGFMRKAYDAEIKKIEEQKRKEEERKRREEERKKLEEEKLKVKQKESDRRKKEAKRIEIAEEFGEEGSEEEIEEEGEEESVLKETRYVIEEDVAGGLSKAPEDSFYMKKSESGIYNEMPFLTKPKYALLRKLAASMKCKDLVPKIPIVPIKKRKVKKVLVKKIKAKPKVEEKEQKEEPTTQEVVHSEEPGEESLTAVRASEFKWGMPLIEYLALEGRRVSRHSQDKVIEIRRKESTSQDVKDEEEEGGIKADELAPAPVEEPIRDEESELTSGLSIGKTESFHSSQVSKEEAISIDEEEDEKKEKDKPDADVSEEEEETCH